MSEHFKNDKVKIAVIMKMAGLPKNDIEEM